VVEFLPSQKIQKKPVDAAGEKERKRKCRENSESAGREVSPE